MKEIQIFKIELKVKEDVKTIFDINNKAAIYHIIFAVSFEEEIYLLTSAKHPHLTNEKSAVIDWTFKTDWFLPIENPYILHLKKAFMLFIMIFVINYQHNPMAQMNLLSSLIQHSSNDRSHDA